MQSILEQTVKTLHEANSHSLTQPDEQHTILDGLRLLSDAKFRDKVLPRLRDSYLLGVVGARFRRLAQGVPIRRPGAGQDPAQLLRVLYPRPRHSGPAEIDD